MKAQALLLAAALAVAAGCAPPQLVRGQLVVLDQRMTPVAAETRLRQPPRSTHVAVIDGAEFLFYRYWMNTGQATGSYELYLLCFVDGELRYWGYVDDFRRHPDLRFGEAIDVLLPDIRAAVTAEAEQAASRR